MFDLTEINKLEDYLKNKEINYTREDSDPGAYWEYHQIIVFSKDGIREWDAILSRGSYGRECNLLEVMGSRVVRKSDGDTVRGWLTAQDVIDRYEGRL